MQIEQKQGYTVITGATHGGAKPEFANSDYNGPMVNPRHIVAQPIKYKEGQYERIFGRDKAKANRSAADRLFTDD